MRKALAWWCGAACAMAAGPGVAQSIPEGQGVGDRFRPEYQPIGGRLGSFILYPSVRAGATATDNALATADNRRADVFVQADADARLVSGWGRHRLETRAYVSQSVHAKETTEDAFEYGASAAGRLDLTREAIVTGAILAERLSEDRTSYEAQTNARRPVRYTHLDLRAGAAYDPGGLLVTGNVQYALYDFSTAVSRAGAVLDQDFRDSTQIGGDATVGYTFRTGVSAIVRAAADHRAYSLSPSDLRQPGNFDRNSSGGRIEAGLRFDLTSLLYGELRAGYLRRSYADPRFRDSAGLSFGADLLWNVTPLTSLRFRADRRIDEAGSTLVAGNRTIDVNAIVDHELLRNLILNASLRYANYNPIGPLEPSDEYNARAGARYLVTRRLSIDGGYLFAKRTSPTIDRRFTENRLAVGAKLTF